MSRIGRLLRPQVPVAPSEVARLGGVTQVPRGLGPAAISPSQPEALAPEKAPKIELPGFNFPPPGSTPVDRSGDAVIAPGASATLVTYVVPAALRFRMEGIGFDAIDDVALGFLTWAILINDAAAPDYYGQTAAVGSIRDLAEIVLGAGNTSVVTVVAFIDATAFFSYTYQCRIRGWAYSETEQGAR